MTCAWFLTARPVLLYRAPALRGAPMRAAEGTSEKSCGPGPNGLGGSEMAGTKRQYIVIVARLPLCVPMDTSPRGLRHAGGHFPAWRFFFGRGDFIAPVPL